MTKINKRKNKFQQPWIPAVLIIAAVLILAGVVLILKNNSESSVNHMDELPVTQFDLALKEKEPIFVFFHSNNCALCIEMINNVDEVFPEFRNSVTLVDVNVYDEKNNKFLLRFGIQVIPTLVFINRNGEGKKAVGVLPPSQLRDQLILLAGVQ